MENARQFVRLITEVMLTDTYSEEYAPAFKAVVDFVIEKDPDYNEDDRSMIEAFVNEQVSAARPFMDIQLSALAQELD